MRSYRSKVGLNPMTGILIRIGKFRHRNMPEECHVTIEVEINVSTSQEHQGLPHQKLQEARKDPPPEPSGRAWLCQHLYFRLLVFWTVRE